MKKRKSQNMRGRRGEEGFVLFTTFMLSLFISTVSFATYTATVVHGQSAERERNRMISHHMAESGVDAAIIQLKEDLDYEGTNGDYTFTTGDVTGGYNLSVSVVDEDANLRLIQVTGFSPDNSSDSSSMATALSVYGNATEEINMTNVGAFGDSMIIVDYASDIRSFDSNVDTISDPTTFNPTSNGNLTLVSNTSVDVDNSSVVDVDITVKDSGTITIEGGSTHSGSELSIPKNAEYDTPTTLTTSQGPLTLNSFETLHLSSGTYHYDSISMPDNAQIHCLGPVTIYVDGDITLDQYSNIRAFNNEPDTLTINATGVTGMTLSNNSHIVGTVNAPESYVSIIDSRFIGSVVSQSLTILNGDVFLDEQTTATTSTTLEGDFELLSWRSSEYSA